MPPYPFIFSCNLNGAISYIYVTNLKKMNKNKKYKSDSCIETVIEMPIKAFTIEPLETNGIEAIPKPKWYEYGKRLPKVSKKRKQRKRIKKL